jgi:hypothetical protein
LVPTTPVGFSIKAGTEENDMHMMKTLRLRQLAALLLAGGSAIAAAETGTASTEAIQPYAEAAGLIPSAAESEATAQRETCHFGMCQDPRFDQPRIETVIGSDVMPLFSSPALRVSGETETGC